MAATIKKPVATNGAVFDARVDELSDGEGRSVPIVKSPPGGLTEFMRMVAGARMGVGRHQDNCKQQLKSLGSRYEVVKAAMGEGSGTIGGYLLPTAISLALLKSLVEKSFVVPHCLRVDMTTRTVQAPFFDLSAGASQQSPFVGGMAFKWEGAAALPETEPTFAALDLTAYILDGYTVISNQMLADAGPEAEQLYVNLFAMAAAFQFEYAMFQGTGSDGLMPLGMINSPCALKVVRAGGAGGTTIAQADVAAMAGHMLPYGWRSAFWAVNPSALPQLFAITGFVPNGWHYKETGCCGFLYTRPVFPTEKVPKLGGTGDLTFFDPTLYVAGLRQEVLVDASPHVSFPNYQTNFRVVLRGDGKPLMNNTATLADGTTTVSQVVVLQ